ncbi:RNA polymerase II-associated protein 1-like [Watersipora subatra]|uniref:RNA polymerase II-associated protein 1-like n=1 Tax=Watersipora subatra TaxID=2589382 RepID=UPI00355C5283
MFAKRPKRGEGDDDLERFQEEFTKDSGIRPAAKVVRIQQNTPTPVASAAPHSTVTTKKQTTPAIVKDIPEEPTQDVLLPKVVERSNVSAFLSSVSPTQSTDSAGFPTVYKLPAELINSQSSKPSDKTKKKKSLFMQQMEAKNLIKRKACGNLRDVSGSSLGVAEVDAVSNNDGFSSMMTEISTENTRKLAEMSAGDILAEQKELVQTLDPNILRLLKERRSKVANKPADSQPEDVEMESVEHTINSQTSKDTVTPLKSEDLPFKPDNNWLHMQEVEHNKLQWLKPLDEKKGAADKKNKLSARFDFNGDLINPDVDIDTRSGLHHHGEEPGSAGYTLEELYILVRSLNLSQKTFALSIISSILQKAKRGDYLYLLNSSITKSLLEADIVLLLRYALDEKSDLVMSAAVTAWHSLLCSSHDQEALKQLTCSLYGHIIPKLSPVDPAPPETEEEEVEREEEQYIEVLKRDVISGLLLMDFVPRLRYILEVVKPQRIVCSQIFEILCRMIMTSPQVAYEVYRTPRLVGVIFELFLPMSLNPPTADRDEHGRSMTEAMRCIRYLCASGKNMAAELIASHSLMDVIIRYVSSDDKSEFGDGYIELMVECLLTWRSLVLYGLALNHYHVVRASLVTRLQHEKNPAIASSLICLLAAFLSAAATEAPAKSVRFSDLPAGGDVSDQPIQLKWTHVAGLIDSVYGLCLSKLSNFIDHFASEPTSFDLDGLISSIEFVSLYLTYARSQPVNLECAVTPHVIAQDVVGLVGRLLVSTAFSRLLSGVRELCVLTREGGYISSEAVPSLPSLCTVEKPVNSADIHLNLGGSQQPPLRVSPFAHTDVRQCLLVKALLQLLSCVLKVDPAHVQSICVQLLGHTEVLTYIKRVSQSSSANCENLLCFVDCVTLIDICQLAASVPTSYAKDYHRCALSLVPRCTGFVLADLYILLNRVAFDPTLFRSCEPRTSPPDPGETGDELIIMCLKSLSSIANTYISLSLPLGDQLKKSRNLRDRNVVQINSMQVGHNTSDLLPTDWPFLPIMHLYQTSTSRKPDTKLPPDTYLLVKNSLQFVYLLEKYHPNIINSIGIHAKIARVMCSFLLDTDLFLEADMQSVLLRLLASYCQHISRINFSQPIPGLISFTDLYADFVQQFEAVSFGNNTFAQYLVLPMMQSQLVDFRKLVWTEHARSLRCIYLKPQELAFPIDELLYPEETNSTIIMHMCRHLLCRTVTLQRNHLLYVVAVHHVNRFMFTTDGNSMDVKQTLLRSAQQCTDESLKQHLIFYKEYKLSNQASEGCQIVSYSQLPASRCQTLKSL